MEPSFRGSFVNANRWFTTMVNQPQVKAVIGEFKLCEKMAQFDAKKFAEIQGKVKDGDKKQEKPKKEQKAPAPKKEAPKKEAAEEAAPPPAPKPKDPLDALPAGNWVMDDFKRFYSNNAEELSRIFMSCNLIGGMFQRLDKLRKNAFASMCVFGEDKANNISGVWVWRGQELAFPLCEDWQIDYESYDWRKMDHTNDADKKLVDQYFKWIGEDSKGRKFADGKIFK